MGRVGIVPIHSSVFRIKNMYIRSGFVELTLNDILVKTD
jgi:hypothetical protein